MIAVQVCVMSLVASLSGWKPSMTPRHSADCCISGAAFVLFQQITPLFRTMQSFVCGCYSV